MAANTKRSFLVAFAIVVACFMSMPLWLDNWRRDLTENSAQFDDAATDPLLRTLVLSIPVSQAVDRLEQWAQSTPNWTLESNVSEGDTVTIHLTRHTRVLRFVDDIQVRLRAVDDQTRVDAVSRARFGFGDLGQNPRNLRELRAAMQGNQS